MTFFTQTKEMYILGELCQLVSASAAINLDLYQMSWRCSV